MKDKTKTILLGMAAGALLGAAFAWIASDSHEDAAEAEGHNPLASLGPADYFQLGISILSLARQFGGMLKQA